MRRNNLKELESLEDAIEKDLSWRKRELLQLRMAIKKNNTSLGKSTLIRSGISLLCAHWEGFVRSAANYYVLYIIDNKFKVNELTNNFVAFFVRETFSKIEDTKKISVYTSVLDYIDRSSTRKFTLEYTDEPFNRIINTESNLSFKLFKEILISLNLDYSRYKLRDKYIDYEMLKQRHEIVHGEDYRRKDYNYEELYNQVIWIMEDFKNQIVDAAEEKRHIK
ncbi:MAE_28990/MAE_18760 family HEPN-like nuclease [Paenibacillus sp. FSL E2-0201]|uniref:MAE_28990/MAE_18760 family HEPN-like nuclease n=1 Tax=Paenibacillus sp. FSL E2-0201 TaxID=2954726 RepID=UPI0030DCA942